MNGDGASLCTIVGMKNEKVSTVMVISSRDFSSDDAFKKRVLQMRLGSNIPILALCKKADMPTLLDLGADDCVDEQCTDIELKARIEALKRRKKEMIFRDTRVHAGGVLIDVKRGEVYLEEKPISLSPAEYRALLYLALHKGELVSKGAISVRTIKESALTSTHLINMHIHNLRKKLGGAVSIITVPRRGFVLE